MIKIKSYFSLVRHPDNASLFTTIEMSILAAEHGQPLHIHAEGLRGTGKTSIIRSAKSILPKIERIAGCLYNCDPKAPHCPEHRHLDQQAIANLGSEWIPMPFLEVSHSAKVATVVGGVDLTRLTDRQHPEAAILPGTIAQAHRGIIFVDEINRLADTSPELADVLLDVMGTKPGRLQIEDAGLPKLEMVSQVTVWAASNPDEDPGPLEGIRRQLADRFDFCVGVRRPGNLATVMAILQQMDDPGTRLDGREELLTVRSRLTSALYRLDTLALTERQLTFLARTYLDHNLESLRALEAITLGVRLHAALSGKTAVDSDDLRAVLPVALKHRTAPHVLADILQALQLWDASNPVVSASELTASAPEEEAAEAEPAEGVTMLSTGDRQSFLNRLFGPLRERREGQRPSLEGSLEQHSGPVPLRPDGAENASLPAALGNPDLITIIAPPNQAKSVKELPESRLLTTEDALRRDH